MENSPQVPSAQKFEMLGILKGYEADFEGAIATFTAGIQVHPSDARLYRHRAHRYLNLRRLAEAERDFERAVELLPGFENHYEYGRAHVLNQLEQLVLGDADADVFPDHEAIRAAGTYYASLPFKVHYHLGLVRHLLEKDGLAAGSFERALTHAENVDLQAATCNWLVVVYWRLGKRDRITALLAAVNFDQQAGVNAAYQELLRLYTGEQSAEQLIAAARGDSRKLATSGYGLASWLLDNGRPADAIGVLRDVIANGDPAAFGTVAAEISLRSLLPEISA